MNEINNRLRFKRISKFGKYQVFADRERAKECLENIKFSEKHYSLYGEPIAMRYFDKKGNLQVLLAIGSSGETDTELSSYHYIDSAKLDEDIKEISGYVETNVSEIREEIKKIKLIPLDTNTVDLDTVETTSGTNLTAKVKIAKENHHKDNILIEQEDGLFVYADLSCSGNSDNEVITFTVSDKNDGIRSKQLLLPKETHLISGEYDPEIQKIILTLNTGETIGIEMDKLIGEWGVLPENATDTPIILTKEPVKYDELINGFAKWQDILKADVRIASKDQVPDNILAKDKSGRYLYVEGKASKITYWKNGKKISVQKAIDDLGLEISTNDGNIIYERPDGIYATTVLEYEAATNTLIFVTSTKTGENSTKKIKLNSAQIFEDVTYDPVTETIKIRYKSASGDYKSLEIPVSSIIQEWTINNENHSVELKKARSVAGKDVLTADVKVSTNPNNILEIQHHELYVRGEADNIKYGDSNVKKTLEKLEHDSSSASTEIDHIEKVIGDRFNEKETITSGFTSHDGRISKLENDLSNETKNREDKDKELEELINKSSGDSVINVEDSKSIHLDKKANTTKGETGYLISGEVKTSVSTKDNLIQTKDDGIFATVDFDYNKDTNEITFTTNNGSKSWQLIDHSVISSINYDKNTEEIVVKYIINDEQKEYRIPMRDLINEWECDNKDKNITLNKEISTEGTDKLSANVNILNETDNLIEQIDPQGNGEHKLFLTVSHKKISGEINKAKDEAIQKVEEEKVEREKKDTELTNSIKEISNTIGTGFTTGESSTVTAKFEKEIEKRKQGDKDLNDKTDTNKKIIDNIIKSNKFKNDGTYDASLMKKTNYLTGVTTTADADIELDSKIKEESNRAIEKEKELEKSITEETKRATGEETKLQEKIDGISYTGISGSTANVLVDNKEKTIEAKVILAASGTGDKQNIIIEQPNRKGLYANVDLQYSVATNTLDFYINGEKTRSYPLNMGALLDEIIFDRDAKLGTVSMVIKYHSAKGEALETRTDVSQMFDNWKVESGNHYGAIELTKEWNESDGKFVLSGGTVISELNDNILVNDKGALYVSGSGITKNYELIQSLSGKSDSLQKEVDNIEKNAGLDEEGNYAPNENTNYIKDAKNLKNADEKLDSAIKEVSGKTDSADEKVDSLQKELDATQVMAFGIDTTSKSKYSDIDNTRYTYLSGNTVTSMVEADRALNDAIKGVSDKVENIMAGSGVTHSAIISGTSDNKLEVNVRLAHAYNQKEDIENVGYEDKSDIMDKNLLRIIHVIGSKTELINNGLYFDGSIDYGTFKDNNS